MAYTLARALKDPSLPVGVMLPVLARTIPAEIARDVAPGAWAAAGPSWTEAYAPMHWQGGCEFGCKVYARNIKGRTQFAVSHSLTYGHRHSPQAR